MFHTPEPQVFDCAIKSPSEGAHCVSSSIIKCLYNVQCTLYTHYLLDSDTL